MIEKISLFVISIALVLLGTWEIVSWPLWALSDSPLFILLGSTFNQLYTLAELSSATAFTIFGIFGVYFAAVERNRSHKLTGRFEILVLVPILVLYFSAIGFIVLGSEMMANNRFLTAVMGRIWRWRFQHSDGKSLINIEESFQCCGWSQTHKFSLSTFCQDMPTKSVSSCTPFVMNHSGKLIYRQGLMVVIYTVPLLMLAGLVIWSHKSDPIAADVEEAEILDQRRKYLYNGEAPAIQIQ